MNELQELRSRLRALDRRTQLAGALGGVCLLALVWLTVEVTSLQGARQALGDARTRQAATVQLAQEYRELGAAGRSSAFGGRGADDILRLLARSGEEDGFPLAQLRRVGDGRVSAAVNDIEYSTLIDYLVTLRARHGLQVSRISIDAAEIEGRVNCQMDFDAAQPE